jgi:hypothetical protein
MADELNTVSDLGRHFVNTFVNTSVYKRKRETVHTSSQRSWAHVAAADDGVRFASLDVRHSRLHAFDAADLALVPLLEGEALAFCRMYEGV